MIGTVTTAFVKCKAALAIISLLLLGGSLYEISNTSGVNNIIEDSNTVNPFTLDIQHRSDLVYNSVSEVINNPEEQGTIAYKQTCESAIAFIQNEKLDTNTNYNTLDEEQKKLVLDYREYLTESAAVVVSCYKGEAPDLTKMNEAKGKLY